MDPYLERPEIFPDFHDSLITYIRGALQPILRPKYVAVTRERIYIEEREHPRLPDVAVVKTRTKETSKSRAATAVMEIEPDVPAVFTLVRDEIKEPLIHIVEATGDHRLITAIEVVSPDNKRAGEGRRSYLEKREEYWKSGVNLIEIDLLRTGRPTVRVSQENLASLPPWRYLVAVTRQRPSREEVYHFPLDQRLPRIAVPLTEQDDDPVLDLQPVFARAWDEGPYPELLNYDQAPPGPMSETEAEWCRGRLKAAGLA